MVEQLARKGVFPAEEIEGQVIALKQFQIDEAAFSTFLGAEAARARKPYSYQNLANDARFLGNVMRLRKGLATRDLSEARSVFITTNRLFATAARRFLINERALQPNQCPPVLHVGQVATIAWLMREHKIDPKKAGRELLSNCYAAIRPDAEWFKNFREAIEKIVGSMEEYASVPENKIKLQAARRIAQDQTFGNSALVRSLNAAELLHLADKAAEDEKERIRTEEAEKAATLAESARIQAHIEAKSQRRQIDQSRAKRFASSVRRFAVFPAIILFVIFAALYDKSALFAGDSYFIAGLELIFLVPVVASTLDLFGIGIFKNAFTRLESWTFRLAYRVLSGQDWIDG